MKRLPGTLIQSVRHVRNRRGVPPRSPLSDQREEYERAHAHAHEGKSKPGRRGQPAGFVRDATTFEDSHTAVNDPYNRLPYPPEQLVDHLNEMQTTKQRARARMERPTMESINFEHIPIEEQIFIMFPGQGAQFVGMGRKVIDYEPSKRLFENASEILGYDVLKLCLEGPKTKLDQTIYTQPAVFVSSLAVLEKMRNEIPNFGERVTEVAGFSIGEYAALVLGQVLTFEDALRIVDKRARLMHECSQLVSSGMVTIRVKASTNLELALREAREYALGLGEAPLCEVSNHLYCCVKVIGGSKLCLKHLQQNSARHAIDVIQIVIIQIFQILKPIPVSGAFHTSLMKPALEKFAAAFTGVPMQSPKLNVYSNFTGCPYPQSVSKIRKQLVNQISNPVKWEQTMQLLYRKNRDLKFPTFCEVGPGRQLGAILREVSKKAFVHYKSFSC